MEPHVYSCLFGLTLSLIVTVSTGLTCENHNCLKDDCTDDGKCSLGCREGYISDYKGQCQDLCTDNCAKCEQSACAGCKPGYFGHQCMKTCDGCKHDSCSEETGQCTTGCKEGYNNEPWCNSTNVSYDDHDHHDHHHHQHHHEKAHSSKVKQEDRSRKLYVSIAGAIIVSVIVSIIAIIILVVRSREGDAKSSYDIAASEHLSGQNGETTEIA